jgi:hypothetical protein
MVPKVSGVTIVERRRGTSTFREFPKRRDEAATKKNGKDTGTVWKSERRRIGYRRNSNSLELMALGFE